MKNKLFYLTRQRLAIYSGGMITFILAIGAIAVYEAIIHAHRLTIDQELKTVAATIHDGLEAILKQPGQWENEASRILPTNCILPNNCTPKTHSISNDKYYVQLFSLSGKLIVTGGMQPLSAQMSHQEWETIKDKNGKRYRQIWFILHTQTGENWGYLQVGRSIQDFDDYMYAVTWLLLLGLPLIIILVVISAWWLAGISINPVYQSYQQMQQFTADAAHELRTPLATLQATIDSSLMSQTLNEQETKETLQTLNRQSKRLINLVQDLLILSRLDWQLSQNNKLIYEKVCLQDLIEDLVEELSPLALAKKVHLSFYFNVDKELIIKGIPEQIYRLFFNLITNAIQYTPKHGKVIITLNQIDNKALINIQDTGIGIKDEEIKKIFNRFYRVNKSRNRQDGGSGLGLSIASILAKNNNVKIEVKSEIGKGSIFTVQFNINE